MSIDPATADPPFSPPISGSYDSSGGAGQDLEASVIADALSAVIADEGHRALAQGVSLRRVTLQRRNGPRGFDDVVLLGQDPSGADHLAYLQVRRAFQIGKNPEFANLVRWVRDHDLTHLEAGWDAVIVSDKVAPSIKDAGDLAQAAVSAVDQADFHDKWRAPKTLNKAKRAILEAVSAALAPDDAEGVWRVFKRLRIVEMDFGIEASRDDQLMVERLARSLEAGAGRARDLREALRSEALAKARLSASYDRAALTAIFGVRYGFIGSASHRKDLARLLDENGHALSAIETTLGEISLLRPELHARALRHLGQARALRLTGEAGCGKSGLLARMAAGFNGPMVVIKEDRIASRTWSDHVQRLGGTISAADLVDELGATGRALLVIDGADRLLLSERRGVIQDLLTAIAARPAGEAWKILTTARTVHGQDIVRDALVRFELPTGVQQIVDVLEGDDIAYVAEAFPKLSQLVLRRDLGDRNLELFSLREHLNDPDADTVGAEIASASRWATRGARSVPANPRRDAAIAQIADLLVKDPTRLVGRGEVDPDGLHALVQDGHIRLEPHLDALAFRHDIYEDWALARAFARDWRGLPARLLAAREPLWWLRAMRLAAQIVLETSGIETWRAMLDRFSSEPGLDPAWARTILTAVLYSEQSFALLDALEAALLEDGAKLLDRFLETLMVLEARPSARILDSQEGDEGDRLRLAAAYPEPGPKWQVFLRWSLLRWASWPPRVFPRLGQIAETWLRWSQGVPHPVGREMVRVCHDWLVKIEDAQGLDEDGEIHRPFDDAEFRYGAQRDLEKQLRDCLAFGVASNPTVVESYLDRLSGLARVRSDTEQLVKNPRRIPTVLPRAYADMAIAHFAPVPPRIRDDMFRFSRWNDGLDYSGLRDTMARATPILFGFDQLFEADPEQALRMLRKFEKRAAVSFRHYMRQREGKRARPVVVKFPWGAVPLWGDENTYRWARGALGPAPLGAAYMALDVWMGKQAAAGRSLESLYRQVLKPHGLNATLVPCITLAVEHINTSGQIGHVGPILAEPRIWSFEAARYNDDVTFAAMPLIGFWDPGRDEVLDLGARYVKRQHIRTDLSLPFLLFADQPAQAAFQDRVATWTGKDLATFEEELESPQRMAVHEAQIARYRADTRPENIKFSDHPEGLRVDFEPDPDTAGTIAETNACRDRFNDVTILLVWARNSLEKGFVDERLTLEAALEHARRLLDQGPPQSEDMAFLKSNIIEGVFATAAVVAKHGDDALLGREHHWLVQLLADGPLFGPPLGGSANQAIFISHPTIHAATALGALVSRNGIDPALLAPLAALAVSPAPTIAAAAVASVDFERAPAAGWAMLWGAIHQSLYRRAFPWQDASSRQNQARARKIERRAERAMARALFDADRRKPRALVLPPTPHVRKLVVSKAWRWPIMLVTRPAPVTLDQQRIVKVLQAIPVVALAKRPEAATALADYLGGLADWVRVKCEGPLKKWREDHFPFELGRELGMAVGRLAFAWPGPPPAGPIWRPLTRFTEREHAVDLMGEVLQGMTEALVNSGGPPDTRFWAAWDPVSTWVLEHGRTAWRDRYGAVGAAGFVGPYSSPLPLDWPHLDLVLPKIDQWLRQVAAAEREARLLLRFCDRFTPDQMETWAAGWIEHIVAENRAGDDFWEDEDNGNRAAALLDGLLNHRPHLADRVRPTLAILADRGSLAARQTLVRLGTRPHG